jgi:hypothetical protein
MDKLNRNILTLLLVVLSLALGAWYGATYGLPFHDSGNKSSAAYGEDACSQRYGGGWAAVGTNVDGEGNTYLKCSNGRGTYRFIFLYSTPSFGSEMMMEENLQ